MNKICNRDQKKTGKPILRSIISLLLLIMCMGLVFSACVTGPRIIPFSTSPGTSRLAAEQILDYPEALTAIVSASVEELKIPVPRADLFLYPNRDAFELGLVKELRFDPTLARDAAKFAWGVGGSERVLVNEAALQPIPWRERIRFLSHEFTHTIQYALSNGNRSTSDQWLREGFADWISYRILESLGLDTFAQRRETRLAQVRRARDRQPFPPLSQMVIFRDWVTLRLKHRAAVTYGQSFLATDFLIQRRGVQAIVDYFRLFRRSDDRIQNFRVAFSEDLSSFEQEFGAYLQTVLK